MDVFREERSRQPAREALKQSWNFKQQFKSCPALANFFQKEGKEQENEEEPWPSPTLFQVLLYARLRLVFRDSFIISGTF